MTSPRTITPDWIPTAMWLAAGILGSGAVWYFLSVKKPHTALWTAFAATVFFLLGVVLYVRNDLIKSGAAEGAAEAAPPAALKIEPFRARLVTVLHFGFPSVLAYRYASALGPRLAPVGLAAVINVENAGGVVTRVTSYALDVRVDGTWVRLHALEALNPTDFFWIKDGNLKTCLRLDFSESAFDPRFRDRDFGPEQIAGGWMFFEWPPELRPKAASVTLNEMRLQLESFRGEKQAVILKGGDGATDGRGGLEGGTFRPIPGVLDLSGIAVLPLMDLPGILRGGPRPSNERRGDPPPTPVPGSVKEAAAHGRLPHAPNREQEDALRRGCVKLNALRKSLGQFVDAEEVAEFHAALDDVTRAGRDVEEFRIPASAFKPQVISVSMRRGHGAQYSSDPLVARDFFDRRIDAVIEYLGCERPA